MKTKHFFAIGLTVLAVGCVAPQHESGKYCGAAAKVAPKHVIVVGWDGFAGNTVEAAEAPTRRSSS